MENSLYNKEPDFEATITVYPPGPTGRRVPARNGIRWDLRYRSDPANIYMIWPEFVTDEGELISSDVPLIGTYRARMYIVSGDMKDKVHREKMKVGVKFYMVEGPIECAEGIVTKILNM